MNGSVIAVIARALEEVLDQAGVLLLAGAALSVVVMLRRLAGRVDRLEREVAALRREPAPTVHRPLESPGTVAAPVAASGPVQGPPPGGTPAPDPPVSTRGTPAAPWPRTRDGSSLSAAGTGGPPPVGSAAAPTRAPFRDDEDGLRGSVRSLFAGGNWLVRGGVLVLFLGVGFLLKFAADNAMLPVHLRLAGVGAGAAAMLWLGLKLAPGRRAYALALQGGGIGLLYLTLYAAFRLYALLPGGAALGLMVAVVAAAGWLAVVQNALPLAVLGALGGFAAPVLSSTGSGDHVMLFSYYAVLNAGVLGLAFFRTWRVLNLVGFAGTFLVGGLWGERYYAPSHFASVEPFLVLFFAMYLAVAVLFALERSLRLRDPMDSTLVFATPLVAFGLQSRLVDGIPHALALSAFALSFVYALCALAVHRRQRDAVPVLVEAFAALAVGFATLALALAFDARWTAASWALEGAALTWVGWRQRRTLARLAGAGLQVLAGAAWVWHGLGQSAFQTGDWLGTVMLAVAGLSSGVVLARGYRGGDERPLSIALGAWGLLWWFGGGVLQIHEQVSATALTGALLLFVAASALAIDIAGARLQWSLLRRAALLFPGALILIAALQVLRDAHPLTALAAVAWPLAVFALAMVLRRNDRSSSPLVPAGHALATWLLAGLGAWELAWWFRELLPPVRSWLRLAWPLAPAALVALIAWRAARRGPWPFDTRRELYLAVACGPLVCALGGAVFALSVGSPGAPWPVRYLPLLNPLDAGVIAVAASCVLWYRAAGALLTEGTRNMSAVAGAALGFVWLNGALLRALHFWFDIPYRFSPMFHSTLAQASLSVLWVMTGLVTMVGASRAASRSLWAVGAALMGAVVVKLMLVDLASSATIARIVSFISVGLVLMLVGYLAPVPPRAADAGGSSVTGSSST